MTRTATALVDQHRARVIVPPYQDAPGFWFGGGNMLQQPDGRLTLVGRYRNQGDSRTGREKGARGLELAIFESRDQGQSFAKVVSLSKDDLRIGDREVLSIEGSALRCHDDGYELFVSTEKTNIGYPDPLADFLKPGAGVWTIDRIQADSLEGLKDVEPTTIMESRDPCYLHCKDPFLYERPDGDLVLLFCTHPFSWSSSNTSFAVRKRGQKAFTAANHSFLSRGTTWDVAMTRGTAVFDLPIPGQSPSSTTMLFYDGGECLRNLDEHLAAVHRPRGYSCEELGGAAYFCDGRLEHCRRLSTHLPLFVSPWGTGCSRYVDVLAAEEGIYVSWQQSQPSGSQPLVLNFLRHDDLRTLLAPLAEA